MSIALVTGGAGFIGSNLVELLLSSGQHVRVLDDLSTGYAENLPSHPSLEFVHGDIRDADLVARCVDGVDVVYHLAASVGNTRSIEAPITDAEINVIGTLNVLEAARGHRVRKVVYSSSAGIFGELKTLPIREDHPIEPDTPYGASKLCAEKQCLAYGRLYGLETVCLRYFNVYGPRQRYDAYGNVIPIFAHRMLRGESITVYDDGEQTRDFVYVGDVAQANARAGRSHGVSGAFNIASGGSVTVNALVALMADALGRPVDVAHAAPRKGDVRHSRADISAAHAAFGFAPEVELRDGLRTYMAWAAAAGV